MKIIQSLKTILIVCSVFLLFNSCTGQPIRPSIDVNAKIKWMSFEEAVALGEKTPKKLFIDVYTDWCGYCKKMDATTFMNDEVADYINKNYYAVKLNAETKDTINFKGTKFVYKPEFKSNELAVSLMNKQMSYPTYIFLDEQFAMLTPAPGYMQPEGIMPLLKFFGENVYKTKSFEEYQKGASPAQTK